MKRGIRRLWILMAFAALAGGCLQAAKEASEPDAGVVTQELVDAGVPDSGPRVPECVVVSPLSADFGDVLVNTTATLKIVLFNNCGGALPITIGSLKGSDPLLFAMVPATGSSITLPDNGPAYLEVQYTPLIASQKQSRAQFDIQLCHGSVDCDRTIQLSATAVSSCLQISPSSLDFGFRRPADWNPGSSFVELTNICSQTALHLTADPVVLNTNAMGGKSTTGPFGLAIEEGQVSPPPSGTAIPPGRVLRLLVGFGPSMPGKFLGELDIATDDPINSSVTIPLTGLGGGSVISCTPESLDFGPVAVGTSATLSTICTNTGTDVPGHPEANLFIPDPNSSAPALTLQDQSPAFAPKLDSPFPALGLAAGQSIAIDVTYLPTIANDDWDRLTISSNGASHIPWLTTMITLTGSGQ